MSDQADDLVDHAALVLYTARHRSRRQAKRLLRDAGGAGTAAELDCFLAALDTHPLRGDVTANDICHHGK